eukprot:964729-Pelagomonas_calceolata.AAC.1
MNHFPDCAGLLGGSLLQGKAAAEVATNESHIDCRAQSADEGSVNVLSVTIKFKAHRQTTRQACALTLR